MTETSNTKSRFKFKVYDKTYVGYGKTYREAARNLIKKGKSIEIPMLVQVISPTKWGTKTSYWDGREFVKELKKGGLIY